MLELRNFLPRLLRLIRRRSRSSRMRSVRPWGIVNFWCALKLRDFLPQLAAPRLRWLGFDTRLGGRGRFDMDTEILEPLRSDFPIRGVSESNLKARALLDC